MFMDILQDSPAKLFTKYLFASFGSAIIISIYSLVDALCVGQYEGEIGTAALACVLPLWTIILSCGLLFGIGGATLMVERRGRNENYEANQFYTLSILVATIGTLILWGLVNLFENELLRFFGASNPIIFSYAKKYTFWMKLSLPLFLFSQVLTCFLRNDGAPIRATLAVISGGVVNILLDICFVFGCKMGIGGAGLATMCGQFVNLTILLTHYLTKQRRIHFVKPQQSIRKIGLIIKTGLPSFVLDIAMGGLTILFNNQIVRYNEGEYQTATLAVFGVICQVMALVQSLSYAVGQASQPLLSQNFGADQKERVQKFLNYGILTSVILSFLVVILLESCPLAILKLFIKVEEEALIVSTASKIQRAYYWSFLFLCFNVFSTYYFQSILKARLAFLLSMLRGIILSTIFLFSLPALFGFDAIWWTMLITEMIVVLLNIMLILKVNFKHKKIMEKK